MSAFYEWWQPTEEYINTTTEYERQRNTWNAALLHAAKVAEKEFRGNTSKFGYEYWEYREDIAARLRQEVGNE